MQNDVRKTICAKYRIAGIFRGVKFSWMFKFSSIRGLMFVVCDVHDHTCFKLYAWSYRAFNFRVRYFRVLLPNHENHEI